MLLLRDARNLWRNHSVVLWKVTNSRSMPSTRSLLDLSMESENVSKSCPFAPASCHKMLSIASSRSH
eukprot:COSAG01_NODE_67665_length_266_cov_0.892216_1_plen_66_part_10